MFNLLLIIHSVLCLFLVLLVMMQQGKGADLGATLSGGSNTVFGAAGATNVLTRMTTGLAVAFMFTSILLARSYNSTAGLGGVADIMEGSVFTEADDAKALPVHKEAADLDALPTGEESTGEEPIVEKPTVEEKAVAGTKENSGQQEAGNNDGAVKAELPVANPQ